MSKKIHAVDIARELDLSKATVSLALNNKPGVSAATRKKILACRDKLQNQLHSQSLKMDQNIVKIILVTKRMNIACDSELGIWNNVFTQFKKELQKYHYEMEIEYFDLLEDSLPPLVDRCNASNVSGVILYATEMNEYDFKGFQDIQKPMIICDNTFGSNYHSVVIDNALALQDIVSYLVENGYQNIVYLSQSRNIYNFLERREGFKNGLRKNHLKFDIHSMTAVGCTPADVTEHMKIYLDEFPLPEVFIMENYQISIGVMNALKEKNIQVPKDVSLIGVDALPDYIHNEYNLKTLNIEYAEKAVVAVMLLQKEIESALPMKLQVYVKCKLDFGNSFRSKV